MAWKPGHALQNGRYVIEKVLGSGGFGITYLAKDNRGHSVAIKTLTPKARSPREFAEQKQAFLNEAECLAQCTHPSIVRVAEVVPDDSSCYLVMEYVEGTDLATLVETKGALPEWEALFYIHQIGDAIGLVHDRGFLHRDIKPLNIIVRKNRSDAVLIDFGFAHSFSQDRVEVHPEYGSRGFAPLEQYDLRSRRGAYSDVYSLAATLYALLTTEVPASATSRDRARMKDATDPLVPPQELNPHISDRVNAAILKGLALDPEHRPQSVKQWLYLLGTGTDADRAFMPPELLSGVDSSPTPPASAVGMDYSTLRDRLAAGEWQAADRETEALMVRVCGREADGKINIQDLKNFPCRDLRTIDKLWREYSDNRFGFSVQRQIWKAVEKNYEAFSDRVGWRQGQSWLPYGKLTFDSSAPEGHLPSWGRRGRFWPTLAAKIRDCSL
ncbi:serine/threonine-protein kinase [Phormidium sp. CCY1219]|uniref:serine/threonine-protein kinase n=1 Tax=Phormidium sp. CCY1219 TaxID=2886104 RepID=UPI002D1F223E|nr:serine/threonine-protein kinase [Phormidium sp. CCY1219]MEB3830639.1 serine/threonine-protein kinase [Phormidium sp. CCY1219]